MVYRVIGLMSGSSLDGLDLVAAEITENGGAWAFEIVAADCYAYGSDWKTRLQNAVSLPALEYQLLHVEYGHYSGRAVNRFIDEKGLQYQIAFIASHGHTTFHVPQKRMTAQLGDGAALAAQTGLPVISDLRALDVAFGGQGAPIVPIGEKLLLKEYDLFLNLGGIANISFNDPEEYIAFDVCPANRVLNALAQEAGREYDAGGALAETGKVQHGLLKKLNNLDYYRQPHPKSLANSFGTDMVYPLIQTFDLTPPDALRTYVAHIVEQIKKSIADSDWSVKNNYELRRANYKLLATGGGAFNTFLISQLQAALDDLSIEIVVPDERLVNYKEALIMAFLGVLRWRQEYTVLPSVTGAVRASIGGALWIGQEA
jgi:anhydro-N-acetylmuramic acid kinase